MSTPLVNTGQPTSLYHTHKPPPLMMADVSHTHKPPPLMMADVSHTHKPPPLMMADASADDDHRAVYPPWRPLHTHAHVHRS